MDDYTSDKLIGMYGDLMAEYALLKIEKKTIIQQYETLKNLYYSEKHRNRLLSQINETLKARVNYLDDGLLG